MTRYRPRSASHSAATVVRLSVTNISGGPKHFDRVSARWNSHPTLAGSYLAACVFLAVLFQESPVGIGGELAGLSEKDLAMLQKAAWQECKSITRERSN